MELPKIFKGLTRDGRAENQLTEKEAEATDWRTYYLNKIARLGKERGVSDDVIKEMVNSFQEGSSGIASSVRIQGKEVSLYGSRGHWSPTVEGKIVSEAAIKEFNEKYGQIIDELVMLNHSGDTGSEDVQKERKGWEELKKIGL